MLKGNMNLDADDDEPGRVRRFAAWTGVMPMTTANLRRAFLRSPMRLVALGALWTLLASFTGSALVERMEKHAAEDRLSFGAMADTCVRAACLSSHFRPRPVSRRFDESGS